MTGLMLIIFGLVSATYAGPVVDTVYGPVEGLTEHLTEESFIGVDSDFDVFLGIPFAKPPVGYLRFTNPERPDPWSENYDATYFRPMCLQMLPGVLSGGVDEDCLYLNVYAPRPMPTNAAVMVWIHGGAYNVGTAGRAVYGGVPLAAVGGVIVVTVNYRLGSLGFLSTGDEAAMGNFGSFDQVMALRWVQENIANFGGDPSRVTIFGESAGGTSVGLHVVSKESQDLFQSAIMQSGSTLTPFAFNPDIDAARSEAFKLGENVGCSTSSSTELVDCLRTKSAVDVLVGGLKFAILSAPVVDNRFLTGNPQDLLEAGDFKHRNILLGSNHDEGTAWALSIYPDYTLSRTAPHMSRADYDEHRDDNIDGVVNDIILDAMDQQYIDWSVADDPNADYLEQYVNEITDQSFAAPADALARAFYQHGAGQAYLYEMTHVPSVSMYSYSLIGPRWLGVTHGEEIPFVFGWAFIPEVQQYRRNLKDEELEFMVKMMQYWTNFAKTGDPNSADLPNWPAFTVPELEYMVLEPDLRSDRALRADTAAFWNGLVPKLAASYA